LFRFLASIFTDSFPDEVIVGSGIGGGLDGDERITIEIITAPIIPAILNRLFILKFQLEYFYSFLIVITRIYSSY